MTKGIEDAARSLYANNKNISVIANNLANLNTIGFKRDSTFYEMLENETQNVKEVTDYQQGELLYTSNPLDFAVEGKGFLVLRNEDSVALTRNGKFKISEEGYLVSDDGSKVMGENGEIKMKENAVEGDKNLTVTKDGEIKINGKLVDKFMIANVEDKNKLSKMGMNKYHVEQDEFVQAEEEDYELHQGFLENSNVNPVLEMEDMIRVSKNYETAQKMIRSFDETSQRANEAGKI